MINITVKDVLLKMKEVLYDEDQWCKGEFNHWVGSREDGGYYQRGYYQHCIIGAKFEAIEKLTGDHITSMECWEIDVQVTTVLQRYLEVEKGIAERNMAIYNDDEGTKYED